MEVRFIDWFAGIGGFHLGLSRAGLECVGAVELEPDARRVYEARFAPSWFPNDVSEVTANDIPKADIWTAGFPCQDLSVAGKRAGFAGSRSGLIWHLLDLADDARPSWIVLENVPGMLTVDGGLGFAELLARMDDLGYVGAWRTLDAQFFGVPQRRRRVFVVACLAGVGSPGKVLALTSGGGGHCPPGDKAWPDAAKPLGRGSAGVGGGASDPRGPGSPFGNRPSTGEPLVAVKTRRGSTDNPGDRWKTGGPAPTLNGMDLRHPSNPATLVHPDPAYCLADAAGSRQGSGRGGLTSRAVDVAPTLTSAEASLNERGVRVVEPVISTVSTNVRRLTPVECERLQGFPDLWTCLCGGSGWASCSCKDGYRYRTLGNSVAVPVVEWIAHRLANQARSRQ